MESALHLTCSFRTIKIKPQSGGVSASPAPVEPQIRPKDRHAAIQATMEAIIKRMKEADHGWDDQIDVSYRLLLSNLPSELIFGSVFLSAAANLPSRQTL